MLNLSEAYGHFMLVGILSLLMIGAVVSLVLSRARLTNTNFVFWLLVILFLPMAGPIAWFINWFSNKPKRAAAEQLPSAE